MIDPDKATSEWLLDYAVKMLEGSPQRSISAALIVIARVLLEENIQT